MKLYSIKTDLNIELLCRMLDDYCDLTIDNGGDLDIMDLWDSDPCVSTNDAARGVMDRISKMRDCLRNGTPMSYSDWQRIYVMLTDATEQYELTHGHTYSLDDQSDYDDAVLMAEVIRIECDEQCVTASQLLPIMADALCGHYGADIADRELLARHNSNTSVYGYIMDSGIRLSDYHMCTAWAMAILGVRDVTEAVEALADELTAVL